MTCALCFYYTVLQVHGARNVNIGFPPHAEVLTGRQTAPPLNE